MSSRDCVKIVFQEREKAVLVECEEEAGPLGTDEIAGKTLVSLVSAGTELAVFQGLHAGVAFPRPTGYAAVFRVEECGSSVEDVKRGDIVFCMGGHSSVQRIRRSEGVIIPGGLPPEKAVFARMMGVTMATLTTTTARPPSMVLVTGLGVVGHLAAQVFNACGYEVYACDPLKERRKLLFSKGVKRVLERVPVEDPDVTGRVSLVIECSGHEQAVLDGCKVVCKRGEVVLTATPWRRRTELSAHDILKAVFHNYVVMRSGWEWEIPLHPVDFRPNSIFGNFAAALQWLAQGRIDVDGLYESVSPENPQEIYTRLLSGECNALTAVFVWEG